MKAVLQYRPSDGFRRLLTESGAAFGVRTSVAEEGEPLLTEMADADVLLHILTPVTAAFMDASPKLKLIQKIGVGVNTIDLKAAQARGIAVCNMPGTNSPAVAEMALTLMLSVLRRLTVLDRETRRGDGWRLAANTYDTVGEVGGRTIGFVGFGASARRLAPALEALGARILYTATAPKPDRAEAFRTFEGLLKEADILSLHAPLTEATRGMMDESAFRLLKPGAILVNTARGELIDETALCAALASGQVRGAGLDVFAGEPIGADHPLTAFDTVVMSPHAAWLTPETLQRSLGVAMRNVQLLQAGSPLLHRVI